MKNVIPKKLECYYLHRAKMQTGDLIEIRSHSFVGCAIRQVTGKHVNHTALVIRLWQYDRDHIFILEALEHGIVLNRLSRRLAELDGKALWLALTDSFDMFRPAVGRAGLNYIGVGYDFQGVFRQLFGHVSADARNLFCSEYAYLALLDAGLPVHQKKAPQPGEMYKLGVFTRPRLITNQEIRIRNYESGIIKLRNIMSWYQKIWNTLKRLMGIAAEVAPEKYQAKIKTGKKVMDALDPSPDCENDTDCK